MTNFNINNSKIGQLNNTGDNIQAAPALPERKTLWNRLLTWYNLLISTAAAVIAWYVAHVQCAVWFLGLK
jgi:hypothetical protein